MNWDRCALDALGGLYERLRSQILHGLHGRHRCRKLPDGATKCTVLPQQEWHTLIPDAHPGYISWEEHETIKERLRDTARAYGLDRRHGPAREGPALLQGRVVCGLCGSRMSVRYHRRGALLVPDYLCNRGYMEDGARTCQIIPGAGIDAAVGELLVQAMTPMAIEVALAVEQEIQNRRQEADDLRRQQLDRAQYEAECARQRYMLAESEPGRENRSLSTAFAGFAMPGGPEATSSNCAKWAY